VVIDLDGFKAYNDTHGHVAGDLYLTNVARVVQDSVRSTVLVLPDCISEHECLAHLTAAGRGYAWSAGATYWQPQEPLDHALRRADERLYQAKSRPR